MLHHENLRNIIRISLKPLSASKHPLWSPAAEEILIMIAAHESAMGKHLRQIGGGPARGIYQVEADTLLDNYHSFLDLRLILKAQIASVTGCLEADLAHLQFNPLYSTVHARLKLYRSPGSLPEASDLRGMAEYAKRYFNSPGGAATPENYLEAYQRLNINNQGIIS